VSAELPQGWTNATIGDVTIYVQRGKSPKYTDRSDLPVVNQKCVRWWGVDARHLKFIHEDQWAQWDPIRSLRPGDILWNSTGTGTIGRAAVFSNLPGYDRVVADSHITILRVDAYEPKLLHRWIQSPAIQDKIESMQAGSTNQVELAKSEVLATSLPVPPLNEQRRIVAKIEALNEKSTRAKQALDAVPPLLEKLRQSILAAAFRGDLTKDWRGKNPNVEPASKLLERIRKERRARWEEAELAKLKAKGKVPSDNKWKQRYEEPEPVDTEGLPELPEGWEWVALEEVAELENGDRGSNYPSRRDYVAEGHPFVTAGHLTSDGIQWNEMNFISEKRLKMLSGGFIETGDILYCLRGSLGKLAIVEHMPFGNGAIGSSLVIIRALSSMNVRYLRDCLASPWGKTLIGQHDNGTAQPNLSGSNVARFAIPLPSEAEIGEIERSITKMLGVVRNLEHLRSGGGGNLNQLNSAILAKAFRGELVPQDPNDEPASVLLERIRRERESASRSNERVDTTKPGKSLPRRSSPKRKGVTNMLKMKDVKSTHLATILKERGALSPEALLSASGLEIDEFYDQLKEEEARGFLRETRSRGPLGSRMLEAAA
jgi:type I restriction enzyme S subunit